MRALVLATPHLHGPDVEHVQALMKKAGWYKGKQDSEYGPLTAQAVYRAKFWLGYRKPDQVAGDVFVGFLTGKKRPTLIMLALRKKRMAADRRKKPLTRGQRLVRQAASQLGTKESPPNSNRVKYSKWYGVIGPWCAMFVTWVFVVGKTANKTFDKARARYAYVPFIVADARRGANGLMLHHTHESGILACYDWNGDGVADHVGICASAHDLNVIASKAVKDAIKQFGPLGHDEHWSLEGNTGVGNDSNGGEVMLRKRSAGEVQAFVKVAA